MINLHVGDCRDVLKTLPDESVQCVVTSPPYYGLRDYGEDGQIGLEQTPDDYVAEMVAVFREVRRVLRDDGTVWLNLGDSYNSSPPGKHPGGLQGERMRADADFNAAHPRNNSRGNIPGLKPKDLIGIPWRVAFALQADGWWLRQDIIWHKPNPMPESVTDRCTKAHEYVFLLSKSARYYYDHEAVKEEASGRDPGNVTHKYADAYDASISEEHRTKAGLRDVGAVDTRNRRSVWTIATTPYSGAHFATFPPSLIEPMILAGTAEGDMVLDPFGGAGTTGLVADRLGRDAILIELNAEYAEMARRRIVGDAPMFARVEVMA